MRRTLGAACRDEGRKDSVGIVIGTGNANTREEGEQMSPYTRKQLKAALAVERGWEPDRRSMKGFTKKFARQVLEEGVKGGKGKKKKGKR
jgi:hypothetical protein